MVVVYLVKYCALSELGNISQVRSRFLARLLTGRKFLKRDSSPSFFNSGMTTASFQQSGKIPDSIELLIMLLITGISDLLQDFSKCVGMGSRQQEVDLEFSMNTRTSSSANSSKASVRVGGIVESLFTSLSSRT